MEFKRRRSKSNMFSLEVMFVPSVEFPLNQQRRSKMHRSYHRRNVHKILYILTLFLRLDLFPSLTVTFTNSCFPFVPADSFSTPPCCHSGWKLASVRVADRRFEGVWCGVVWCVGGGGGGGEVLLDLTSCGGSSLAAHAGGVDCFRGNQIQVLVIRDLIEPVPILQELDVQVLVDLLG